MPEQFESLLERFERRAEEFYRETGYVAPGKDVPAAMGSDNYAERLTAWRAWNAAGARQWESPPPSDAGTSERETGKTVRKCDPCANCGHEWAAHRYGPCDECARIGPSCRTFVGGPLMVELNRSAAPAAESPRVEPGPGERGYIGCPFCPDSGCLGREHHPMYPLAAPAAEGPRAVKRPVRCGSGHPDGYLCERPPNHAGEHCAFIGAHDEQGKIPELSWPAAALPGAEAGTPDLDLGANETFLTEEQERNRQLVGSLQVLASFTGDMAGKQHHAKLVRRMFAALTSEVRALTARIEFAAQQEKAWESALEAAMAEVARLTEELRIQQQAHARTYTSWERERTENEAVIASLQKQIGALRGGSRGAHNDECTCIDCWTAPDAARLASPSPTGAPAEQQKN